MFASIIIDRSIQYPEGDTYYSPSFRYPEYRFSHISNTTNNVYNAFRETLHQSGLDIARYGTPDWNPLGEFIKTGKKVFVLCNFVYHRRRQESLKEFYSKCTHASILRALIDYVYIATGPSGIISFGNAPLQTCVWEKILEDTGASMLIKFYKLNSVNVLAKDLRLLITSRSLLGQLRILKEIDNSAAALVDLDRKSLLEGLYKENIEIRFRVSDYSSDRTESYHRINKHRYVINNEILSSDVIISVPKLKTHEKVGITTGLKGFVGCVGHKDCIAHHRFGPPKINGDEYPDNGLWQILLSRLHDFVSKRKYPGFLAVFFELIDQNSRRIVHRIFKKIQAGAWYGNDTAWRMCIDLAHIMHFADKNGKMSNKLQRKHIVVIDGVIGGERNGPLSPTPVESKTIIFSDNIVLGDVIASKLMGYDPVKNPLLRYSMQDHQLFDLPIARGINCIINGKKVDFNNVNAVLGRPFIPPDGWKGFML